MTIIVITGASGIGKTTIVTRVAQELKERGVRVGGIISKEVRTSNVRTGFEFVDLATNDRNILASVTGKGPRVGKYFVNLSGCHFAADRLNNALIDSEVIICDEIGPMELKSDEFVETVAKLFEANKKVIIVIHQNLKHPLINETRKRSTSLIKICLQNDRRGVIQTILESLYL